MALLSYCQNGLGTHIKWLAAAKVFSAQHLVTSFYCRFTTARMHNLMRPTTVEGFTHAVTYRRSGYRT
jgi:hypothetical protein